MITLRSQSAPMPYMHTFIHSYKACVHETKCMYIRVTRLTLMLQSAPMACCCTRECLTCLSTEICNVCVCIYISVCVCTYICTFTCV